MTICSHSLSLPLASNIKRDDVHQYYLVLALHTYTCGAIYRSQFNMNYSIHVFIYVCMYLSLSQSLHLYVSVSIHPSSLTHSRPSSLLPSLILSPGGKTMSGKLTSLLENIAKPAWYVLPPGGTITCRKWRVCTDLKNAHLFLCD